ncbi:MAG: hypothetical protein FK733_09305 [Asgard group archaeon]|nr:hypothetical protein [Asgard group archaeon]
MSRVIEQRRGLFQIIFLSFSITIAVFLLLLILAMIYYPGGNFAGEDIAGYSLLYNGLCDMRESTAVNHEPNLVSSILLKIGIVILSIATIIFFVALSFLFQDRRITKYLSIIGSFFGIIQGPFNALVIFSHVPFNIHMVFVIIAPLFQYLAVILYTIVYFIDRGLPKLNWYSFLVLSIAAILLSIFVGIASGIGGDFNFITQRLGTNLFNFLGIIIYIIQGLSLYFYLKKPDKLPNGEIN